MSNILIELAAEFTGKNAFKQADTATQKLYKTTKKLAASLGIAFGAKAVIAYSKASMKAAAADQKSQSILASNLKNLGLAYANVNSEAFIKSMETQTHIADDLLRPAYSQLAQVTGSIALTQKVMAIAFDTANGAGLDYSATINILSQAYVGNRKGLKQLQTGLTTAQLAALSFDELLVVLTQHFGGAGEAAIKGYAGQMDALSISMGNVQEILGGALLDSFAQLAGGGNITKATTKVEEIAEAFAGLLKVLTGVYDMNAILNQVEFGGFLGVVPKNKPASSVAQQSPGDRAAIDKANAAAKKRAFEAGAAARKLAKAQADAAAKKAIADKKSADLSKAAAAFDLTRISIAAALKATYDNDTKLRLLAMQAIENEDGEKALDYLNQLKILQDSVQTAKLAGITTISSKSLEALNATLLAELAAIDKTKMSEADKTLARDAAFAKYNDALTKQGGLAALNEYNERVQIQLTSIAKLAAIAKTGAALATLNTIMVSNELAIATTQSANDLARYDALKSYIALLGVAYDAAIALAQANAAAKVIVPPGNSGGSKSGGNLIKDLERGILTNTNYGVISDVITSTSNPGSNAGNNNSNNAVLNFNAPIYTISDAEFAANVQRAVQNNNRFGNNLDYAGAI